MTKSRFNLRRVAKTVACLAVVMMFVACNDDNNGNSNGSNNGGTNGNGNGVGGGLTTGSLTINGLPAGPAYDITLYKSGTVFTTKIDIILAKSGDKFVARGGVPAGGGNVFALWGRGMSEVWMNSGTNLVIVLSESADKDFISPRVGTVPSIVNGVGEVNYSALTPFVE